MNKYFVALKNLYGGTITIFTNKIDDTVIRMYIETENFKYEDGIFSIYNGYTITRHERVICIRIIEKLYITASIVCKIYKDDLYSLGNFISCTEKYNSKDWIL